MEGPISIWGYKEQESNLILPEHDDDDDDDKSGKSSSRPRCSRLHKRDSTEWRFMIPSAEEDTIHREILTFYDTKLHK
jgi:hypothetical protein